MPGDYLGLQDALQGQASDATGNRQSWYIQTLCYFARGECALLFEKVEYESVPRVANFNFHRIDVTSDVPFVFFAW